MGRSARVSLFKAPTAAGFGEGSVVSSIARMSAREKLFRLLTKEGNKRGYD
jgi:hypothetical protein